MPPVHYRTGAFPPDARLDWPRLIPLIGPAAAAVARYDGVLAAVPHPSVLLAPLATQEAVLSSRIEGTRATMGEVLEYEAGRRFDSPALLGDIGEILNYRLAMRRAEELLQELPLCLRVIREAHLVLLQGVRGTDKAPGELRRIPNWIGPPGCGIADATFVPIGAEELSSALSRWESYVHEDPPDRLVQLAVLHAEFEALHPFLDGNGRLGRMLVPLFLWQRRLIREPVFYLSGYFEERRSAYYEGLLAVSRDDDWTGWCVLFLEAVRSQAESNLAKAQGILDLYEEMVPQVTAMTRSPNAVQALRWLFGRPILRSADFAAAAGLPPRTAHRLLRGLLEAGILTTVIAGNGRRATVLGFPALLNLVEGRRVL